MANLAKAQQTRVARAELKIELAEGARTLAEVLRADEDFVQTMRVRDLLVAVPQLGPVSAQRALIACQLSPTAPLGRIPATGRERLIAWLQANRRSVDVGARVERELFGGKGGYR